MVVSQVRDNISVKFGRKTKKTAMPQRKEAVDHPAHYGGADNPYEVVKVIEAWRLGFNLGNTVKYIARAGKKGDLITDLKKGLWYLAREISKLEQAANEQLTKRQADRRLGSRFRPVGRHNGKRPLNRPGRPRII